jgi:hypothetical protein
MTWGISFFTILFSVGLSSPALSQGSKWRPSKSRPAAQDRPAGIGSAIGVMRKGTTISLEDGDRAHVFENRVHRDMLKARFRWKTKARSKT